MDLQLDLDTFEPAGTGLLKQQISICGVGHTIFALEVRLVEDCGDTYFTALNDNEHLHDFADLIQVVGGALDDSFTVVEHSGKLFHLLMLPQAMKNDVLHKRVSDALGA